MSIKPSCIGGAFAAAVALQAGSALSQPVPGPLVIHNADVASQTVLTWERGGKVINAPEGSVQDVPPDAARIRVKIFNFPTGVLREMQLSKGTRTPSHLNEADIIVYTASGRQIQVVDGKSHPQGAGDAAFHPVGVWHHSEIIADSLRAEFAFQGRTAPGARPLFLSTGDAPLRAMAENASAQARVFALPGYGLVEAHYRAGFRAPPAVSDREQLTYVLTGKLKVAIGDHRDEVVAGDVFRTPMGLSFAREALEDTVTLEADASHPPPRRGQ